MVAELRGAQGEAGVSGRGSHVRVRRGRGRRRGERGFELVRVGVAGLVVRVDGRGREEPVRVSGMVVGADAQGHLMD